MKSRTRIDARTRVNLHVGNVRRTPGSAADLRVRIRLYAKKIIEILP